MVVVVVVLVVVVVVVVVVVGAGTTEALRAVLPGDDRERRHLLRLAPTRIKPRCCVLPCSTCATYCYYDSNTSRLYSVLTFVRSHNPRLG